MTTHQNSSAYDQMPEEAQRILDEEMAYLFRMERETIHNLKQAVHDQMERGSLDEREMWGLLTRAVVDPTIMPPERVGSLLSILLIDTVYQERASSPTI